MAPLGRSGSEEMEAEEEEPRAEEVEERVEEAPEEPNGPDIYLDPRDRRVFRGAPALDEDLPPGPADLGF